MIAILRSLAFATFFYLGSVPLVIVSASTLLFGGRGLPTMVRAWTNYHRWCARWLTGIRVRIEGEYSSQPVLYAMRHESFFEAIDLPTLFDRPAVFAKQELGEIPLWGRAARAYGLVFIARHEGAKTLRTMVREARAFAAKGRPLVIFPEGTRTPHGERGTLQSGFAGLYTLLRLPVVPVAVDSGPLYRGFVKRAGTVTYRFGERIEPGLKRAEIEERVQQAITGLNQTPAPPTP